MAKDALKSKPPANASRPAARAKMSGGRPAQRVRPPRRRQGSSKIKRWVSAVLAVIVLGGLITALALTASNGGPGANPTDPPSAGPEGIPVPAGTSLGAVNTPSTGKVIHGISCLGNEQLAYHVHAHLTIFVKGVQKQVPYGIGMAPPVQTTPSANGTFASSGGCFYWLHTHASDGVIHVESPTRSIYTLGDFFAVWGQPLKPNQVGPAKGKVTAFLNGKPYTGQIDAIPLDAHNYIQLDVGTPVVPAQAFSWGSATL